MLPFDELTDWLAGPPPDVLWHQAISERGQVVCPTCSIVTRKTVPGLKKHMEICQKVRGPWVWRLQYAIQWYLRCGDYRTVYSGTSGVEITVHYTVVPQVWRLQYSIQWYLRGGDYSTVYSGTSGVEITEQYTVVPQVWRLQYTIQWYLRGADYSTVYSGTSGVQITVQ